MVKPATLTTLHFAFPQPLTLRRQSAHRLATGINGTMTWLNLFSEVELQVIGSRTTRMRSVAKDGVFFKDRATATEIILQTERILNQA